MKYIYQELRLKKKHPQQHNQHQNIQQVLSLSKRVVIFECLMLMVLARKLA